MLFITSIPMKVCSEIYSNSYKSYVDKIYWSQIERCAFGELVTVNFFQLISFLEATQPFFVFLKFFLQSNVRLCSWSLLKCAVSLACNHIFCKWVFVRFNCALNSFWFYYIAYFIHLYLNSAHALWSQWDPRQTALSARFHFAEEVSLHNFKSYFKRTMWWMVFLLSKTDAFSSISSYIDFILYLHIRLRHEFYQWIWYCNLYMLLY